MNRNLLLLGLIVGSLKKYIQNFNSKAPWFVRFVVFSGITASVLIIQHMFVQLPKGTSEVLLTNLHNPQGLILTLILGGLFMFSIYLGLVAKNMASSL